MRNANMENPLQMKQKQNEVIYQTACRVLGGTPRVFRYYDQGDEVSVDLLTAKGSPREGRISYSTLGLIHNPIGLRKNEKPLRLEICGGCLEKYEYFPNLLSSCCFDIINCRFVCADGAVLKENVNAYVQRSTLRHTLFCPFSLWDSAFPELSFEDKTVNWLYALPISDGELRFLEANGSEELLRLIRKAGVDVCDLERPAVR